MPVVFVACATDGNLVQVHLHKQHLNPCAGHPPVYQDLSACHDWPVKQKQCQFASQVEGTCK